MKSYQKTNAEVNNEEGRDVYVIPTQNESRGNLKKGRNK